MPMKPQCIMTCCLVVLLMMTQNMWWLKCQDTKRCVSSSSLAQQHLVGPGLPKKLCPFVSVEDDYLPILDP